MSIEQPRFVYLNTEPNCWTVGHYSPAGEWHGASDHESAQAAAEECHYLNGGDKYEQHVIGENDVLVVVYKQILSSEQLDRLTNRLVEFAEQHGVKVAAIVGPDECYVQRKPVTEAKEGSAA